MLNDKLRNLLIRSAARRLGSSASSCCAGSSTGEFGTESEWVEKFWVWGVPADGDAELVYSWPAEDLPESSLPIDGDLLRDAAARAVTLWAEPGDEDLTV